MYVKVATRQSFTGARGDFLHQVHPPIYSDFIAAKLPDDAKWDGDELVSVGSMDFGEAMGVGLEFLHLLDFQPDLTVYEKNSGQVAFRYVWWNDPQTGLTAVVTTRKIYILGENGKTIDRV